MSFDSVIRNGRVVTSAMDAVTDVGIKDGRVAAMGSDLPGPGVDATGLLVLPGGVDMHVHLTESPLPTGQRMLWADDFESGSRAAAAGGITTIGNMTYPDAGENLLPALRRHQQEADAKSVVDYVMHVVVAEPTPDVVAEIEDLVPHGHNSIKLFLSRPYFEQHTQDYLKVLEAAGRSGVLPLIHCEDSAICHHLAESLADQGKLGAEYYGDSRPDFAEESAIVRALSLGRAADCPVYIVHVSTESGAKAVQRAKSRGWPVFAETRPLYLYQTDEVHATEQGAKWVGRPPVRRTPDVAAMWAGLASGTIDTYCSDHAPWRLEEKLASNLNVGNNFLAGHADLDTLLPQFYDHAVSHDGMSLQHFVRVTSENAAKIFGLFPQKGTIAIGSDADIVLWDPDLSKAVDSTHTQTRSDFSLYEGQTFTGWPVVTMVRGQVVYSRGEIVASSGHGRLVQASNAARSLGY